MHTRGEIPSIRADSQRDCVLEDGSHAPSDLVLALAPLHLVLLLLLLCKSERGRIRLGKGGGGGRGIAACGVGESQPPRGRLHDSPDDHMCPGKALAAASSDSRGFETFAMPLYSISWTRPVAKLARKDNYRECDSRSQPQTWRTRREKKKKVALASGYEGRQSFRDVVTIVKPAPGFPSPHREVQV